jgi:hypothetical protein
MLALIRRARVYEVSGRSGAGEEVKLEGTLATPPKNDKSDERQAAGNHFVKYTVKRVDVREIPYGDTASIQLPWTGELSCRDPVRSRTTSSAARISASP